MRIGSIASTDVFSAVSGYITGAILPAILLLLIGVGVGLYFWHRQVAQLRRAERALEVLLSAPEAVLPLCSDKGLTGKLSQLIPAISRAMASREAQHVAEIRGLETELAARTRDYLSARDEARAAVAMRAELLASLSHDLRAPLSGLGVLAETLAAEPLPGRARHQAKALANSGRSLLATLNDILDVSHLRGGRSAPERSRVDLSDILADVTALFQAEADEKGLELVVSVAADTPRYASADPVRLEQILSGLIANALRHTVRGHVLIRAEADRKEGFISLTVSDTGEGISRARLRALFHADTGLGLTIARQLTEAMGGMIAARSKPGEGTHIRLRLPATQADVRCQPSRMEGCTFSICVTAKTVRARLVDHLIAMGGVMAPPESADIVLSDAAYRAELDIEAERHVLLAVPDDTQAELWVRQGRAACRLRVPINFNELNELIRRLNKSEPLAAPCPTPINHKEIVWPDARVLIVDDSDVSRNALSEALSRFGIRARTAADGRQALQRLAQERYDLVLMDTLMPGMDGYQATRQLRLAEGERRRTPVIALSANADDLWRTAGMDGVLIKPLDLMALRSALARHLPEKLAQRPRLEGVSDGLLDSSVVTPLLYEVRAGAAFARTSLRRFRAEAGPITAQVKASVADADRATTLHTLSALRPICDAVGAKAVSDLAEAMQACMREGLMPPQQYTDGLTRTLNDTLHALSQLILDTGAESGNDTGNFAARFAETLPDRDLEMMRALETDLEAGCLQMLYQPIFERTGTRIIAAEALIRWPRKNGTPIGPSVFIPLAERYGLIERIGMFARRRVFEETRDWALPVAVNVSPLELDVPGFVSRLRAVMQETGYDPHRLIIEVTETALLNDAERTRRQFEALRQMGVQLSLDDFGVGYSSLTALHRFAFDKIKIDREFIMALGDDVRATQEALAIIQAVTGLGRAFGMQVVAEGIETRTQHFHLKASGVNAVQGFLFGHPQTAESFAKHLRQDVLRTG